MTDEKQEKMMQFQVLQNNFKMLDDRLKLINSSMEEFERTKLALEEIGNNKGEAYIPLGSSYFVLGKVENNEEILVSIGAGMAVKKKRNEAIKMVLEKMTEFEKASKKVMSEMNKIETQLLKIQNELE
ncbi:MAG: prefoldin subunit alpha [Nanoarchaeota archaeon]|nr:prefoldin subunit alpha [Nanoarchaeota archaeon]MBU4123984.1 prefoldin subunit alpha [Nanoarchaeota archaeon]